MQANSAHFYGRNKIHFSGDYYVKIPEQERELAKKRLTLFLNGDKDAERELEHAIHIGKDFTHQTNIPWKGGSIPIEIRFSPDYLDLNIRTQPQRAGIVQCKGTLQIIFDQDGKPQLVNGGSDDRQALMFYLLLQALEEKNKEHGTYWSSKLSTAASYKFPGMMSRLKTLSIIGHPNIKTDKITLYTDFQIFCQAFLELPKEVQNFVLGAYTLYPSNYVLSVYPEYEGKPAYGHGPGHYYDTAAGLYSWVYKEIVVAFNYYASPQDHSRSYRVQDPKRVLRHEVGHALLSRLGRNGNSISEAQVIQDLYRSDHRNWAHKSRTEKEKLATQFAQESVEEICTAITEALLGIWAEQQNTKSAKDWLNTPLTVNTDVIVAFPKLSLKLCNLIENKFNMKWKYDWAAKLELNNKGLQASAVDSDPGF